MALQNGYQQIYLKSHAPNAAHVISVYRSSSCVVVVVSVVVGAQDQVQQPVALLL